ncbi:MAG TPA: hypothetical protein VFF42_03445 [Candidatus Eremiobacteraceae bacterium]|nr:hypothetical protein [Candidatus Eremiobacteraceae bacterium]
MQDEICRYARSAKSLIKLVIPVMLSVCLLVAFKPEARAVPSYSRQTGLPCATCHFAPPELTPFGRKFKLDGYVFTTKAQVTDDKKDHNSALRLLEVFPLSVVFDTSYTATKSPQPGTQNGNFQLPQDVSLFLAGAWGSHVGSFAQVTYTGVTNHFSWDNTDVRYGNSERKLWGKPFTYGVTFNNNPTVEDLWNSTPAWGFPFTASNVSPTPMAKALINGALGQDVAGLGGYTMWNEHLYVGGTVYRSQHIGGAQPNPGTGSGLNIRGFAPYWRVAWQTTTKNNSLEVGTYGIHAKTSPFAVTGPTDSRTDWALDFQYDRTIPQFKNDVLSFRGTYIRENSTLNATFGLPTPAASQLRHHLNTAQANAEYHFGTKFSGTVGLFSVTGTPDILLYAANPVTGSANGDPRSNGYILNFSWWPEQNIDLAVQYTGYWRFNGAQTNYDGAGRNASSNNAVFLLGRFVF